MAGARGFSRHRFSILATACSTHTELDTVPSSESSKSKINYNAKLTDSCDVESMSLPERHSRNYPVLQLGQKASAASSPLRELSSAIESHYLESCL